MSAEKILYLISVTVLLLALVSQTQLIKADYNQKNITVNVTVQAVTEITVLPTIANWTNLPPGSVGDSVDVSIINTGSANLTYLYAYAWTIEDESSRPYGTGNPQSYSASGVIKIEDEGSTDWYWVGRLEWNWTEDIIPSRKPGDAIAWGFYKNTSYEYFWTLSPGSNGRCNESTTSFRISKFPDDGTTGTRNTADTGYYTGGTVNYNDTWAFIEVDGAPAFDGLDVCVAAYYDCSKIYIYKYDGHRTGFKQCGNVASLLVPNFPGNITTVKLDAFIPKGIPAGILKLGTITFVGYA